MSHIVRLFKDKEGISVFEYGVISFVISLATLAAIVAIEYHIVNFLPTP